jgi:phosphoribosyl 1,2-cyclic phosphate phosphodiesterase
MKITFLGTAASPSMPVPFCQCPVCIEAATVGGPNVRRKSSLLINQDLVIDLGPDSPIAFSNYNIRTSEIKYILQTHSHSDHIDTELLAARHPEYGSKISGEIVLAGSEKTIIQIDNEFQQFGFGSIYSSQVSKRTQISIIHLEPFNTYKIGKYEIYGYPANHDHENDALIYSIFTDEHRILYATDTSVLNSDVWENLVNSKVSFDLVIFDHTYGIGFESTDHLSAKEIINYVKIFKQNNIIKDDVSFSQPIFLMRECTSIQNSINMLRILDMN